MVIITGASSGIGSSIAKVFDESHYKTIILGRDKRRLDVLKSELKHCVAAVSLDLTLPFESLRVELEKSLKNIKPDILINNAGAYQRKSISEDNDDVWDFHYQTNLMSAVKLTRFFWPLFLKQKKGQIINISSTLSLRPIESTSAYSAIKAAMNNWTQALALEGGPHNIRANSICPGIVDTPIHSFHNKEDSENIKFKNKLKKMQPIEKLAEPIDIAKAIFAISQADWITGATIPIDGGLMLTSRDLSD